MYNLDLSAGYLLHYLLCLVRISRGQLYNMLITRAFVVSAWLNSNLFMLEIRIVFEYFKFVFFNLHFFKDLTAWIRLSHKVHSLNLKLLQTSFRH